MPVPTSTSSPSRPATWWWLIGFILFTLPLTAQNEDIQDQIFPDCDHPDFPALMSFYASTNGASWTNNTGWAAGAAGLDCEPCRWWGVDCNQAGRVTVIKLPFNNLTGTLPTTLGDITTLRALVLQSNAISGQLPFSIENLNQLRVMDISKNQLSGYIPTEIGDLTLLKFLLLSNNNLAEAIPQELGDLTNLQVLHLNDNNLSCFYDELDGLCSVPDVDFSNNPLLPWEGDFTPYCAGEEQLGAPCNGDNVIQEDCSCGPPPPCHPDIDALLALYNSTDGPNWANNDGWVDGAAGTDCAPCSWYGVNCGSDGRVRELSLNVNNLNGVIPAEIGELSSLIYLNLGSSPLLSGTIPTSITALENLQFLFIYNANLQGNLPQEIGAMSSLIAISLSNNNLSGTIPGSILELSLIREIILRDNALTGGIPEAIGNLPNLRRLDLSLNQLSGHIPVSLGNAADLWQLNLHQNQFEGMVPPQLANATNLEQIRLQNNNLTGPIPAALAALPELDLFDVSQNDLEDCMDNLLVWCDLPSDIYQYFGNRRLPWFGNKVSVCTNDPGTPAPCDPDGDPNTPEEGVVNAFCECVLADDAGEGDKDKGFTSRGGMGTMTKGTPQNASNGIRVSPNPVGHDRILHLSLPDPGANYSISLSNIAGEVVIRTTLTDYQNRLNLGELAPGLYFLRVHGKRKDEVKKIVIR